MSYLEKSLAGNERILYRAQIHWIFWFFQWVRLGFFLILIAVAKAAFPDMGAGLIAAAVGIAILIFLSGYLRLWFLEMGVTSHRVIRKRGWIVRETAELALWALEEVDLSQSLPGRIFDFGSVSVHGTGIDDLVMDRISNPIGLRRAIEAARQSELAYHPKDELRSHPDG